MWTERQTRGSGETEAEIGRVTIGGNPAAVETRGEVRDLPVYAPGGYFWTPRRGDRVLVIKGGPGGAEQCVAAMEQAGAAPEQGDVALRTDGASLVLRADGRIELTGQLWINGQPFGGTVTG